MSLLVAIALATRRQDVTREALLGPGRMRVVVAARRRAIQLLRESGWPTADIAKALTVDVTTVRDALRRLR